MRTRQLSPEMKFVRLTMLLFVCILQLGTLHAQESTASDDDYKEYMAERMQSIRQQAAALDATAYWTQITQRSTEANESVTYHQSGNQLKVTLVGADATTRYYLFNNALAMVTVTSGIPDPYDGPDFEEFFFEAGTLFRATHNKDCGAPFSQEYRDSYQETFLTQLDMLRALNN